MKRIVLALAVTLAAMTAASAQTVPSQDAVKACVNKISAAYPLALSVNLSYGGLFLLDECLRGQL